MNRFDVITILFKFDPVLDAFTVPSDVYRLLQTNAVSTDLYTFRN